MNGGPRHRHSCGGAGPLSGAGLARSGSSPPRLLLGDADSHACFLAALAGALAVTCISAALVLSSPVPTERQRAIEDGRQVLSYLWRDCGNRCTVRAVTQTTPGTWRVRLQTPRWRRCFLITPADYAYVPGHGVAGLSATASLGELATSRPTTARARGRTRPLSAVHFLNPRTDR